MNDVVAIQHGLYHGLRSCSLFADANIVLGRRLAIESEAAMDAIWQTPAQSGKTGVGLIVQIPELIVSKPNSRAREREFSIGIYEERNLNFTPGLGTLRTAEDWSDAVVDFLWNWQLWRAGGLIPAERAVVADNAMPGIVGLRCLCRLTQVRTPTARAATPSISVAGTTVTLTTTDAGTLYYTTDGYSSPLPDNTGAFEGEQAATAYGAPFEAAPGTVILAASILDGALPSHVASHTLT